MLRMYVPEGWQRKQPARIPPAFDFETVFTWTAILLFCICFWTLVWMWMGTHLFVRFIAAVFATGIAFAVAYDLARAASHALERRRAAAAAIPEDAYVIKDRHDLAPAIVIARKPPKDAVANR